MPFCKNCGEEIPEDSVYCPSCGTKQSFKNKKVEKQSEKKVLDSEERIDNSKTKLSIPWIYVFVAIVLVVFLFVFYQGYARSEMYLRIDGISYKSDSGQNEFPISLYDNGKIRADVKLDVSTLGHDDSLNYKIYDKTHNKDLISLSSSSLARGKNTIYTSVELDSLEEDTKIEICASKKHFSDKTAKHVKCDSRILYRPNIQVSVEEPIYFNIRKKHIDRGYYDLDPLRDEITISNTGEVPMIFCFYAPNAGEDSSHPEHYPQYGVSGLECEKIAPGAHNYFKIINIVSLPSNGEFIPVSKGEYRSTGYVWIKNLAYDYDYKTSLYKKEIEFVTDIY